MRKRICQSGGPTAGAAAKIVLVNGRFQLERLDISSLTARKGIQDKGNTTGNLQYLAENRVAITEGFMVALKEVPCVTEFFASKDLTSIGFKNSFNAMKSFNAAFRDHLKRTRAKEGPYFIELGIIFESRRPNYGGAIFLLRTEAEE